MNYQVLARKWRPQTFSDVVGQEHILVALDHSLSVRRIHHAYLFSGTRGVGKTTIVRLIAKGLNCETGITANPCRKCVNCCEIEQGRFVDLIEIDAASKTKVEDTRDLLDNVQYAPTRGRFKIYLIDEVHMLSRHSFNALLKTLEEPPTHVKFLLATTDPKKLPITILSRCLQFHLRALNIEQIRNQIQRVLIAEQITSESHALELLARAADGSMRDALSLTDQAIAIGGGKVTFTTVSKMLGAIDETQAFIILEALINSDCEKVMSQVAQSVEKGIDLENLLIETLTLLHRIAMIQLLPKIINKEYSGLEQRLHKLAHTLPPVDIQIYYQTLLIGRKELPYAPDRRMGVEMTFLRALAFFPKSLISGSNNNSVNNVQTMQTESSHGISSSFLNQSSMINKQLQPSFSETTVQLLKARNQIREKVEFEKKSELISLRSIHHKSSSLELLKSKTLHMQQSKSKNNIIKNTIQTNIYNHHIQNEPRCKSEILATSKLPNTELESKQKTELLDKIILESMKLDSWTSEIYDLKLPNFVEQLALNTFKTQQASDNICLHLKSTQCHLNSLSAQKILSDTLSTLYNRHITLSIVIDDSMAQRTPLEWRQFIYEEKMAQARQLIIADTNIPILRHFFDAELDMNSIHPI